MTGCSCYYSSNNFFIKIIMLLFVSNSCSTLVVFRAASHDNDGSVTKDEGSSSNLTFMIFSTIFQCLLIIFNL